MAPIPELPHFANPLASPLQLEISASQLDGVPRDIEDSVHYETARLLQVAGILLRLPQEIIAQSVVTLQRFWAGPDGGSLLDFGAQVCGTHRDSKVYAKLDARIIVTDYEVGRCRRGLIFICEAFSSCCEPTATYDRLVVPRQPRRRVRECRFQHVGAQINLACL